MQLTQKQEKRIEYLLDFFQKNPVVEDRYTKKSYDDFDKIRMNGSLVLKKMIMEYLSGSLPLEEFKSKSEKMSRELPYWGFVGFSGQMQINQYVKHVKDEARDEKLKIALALPKDLEEAKEKINTFADYLRRLKTESESPQKLPRINQSYMLSYFWELQSPGIFPVFYGSSKNILENIGFDFKAQETPGDEYKYFADIFALIYSFLEKEKGIKKQFPFWFIEHILWVEFKRQDTKETEREDKVIESKTVQPTDDNWIPLVIADLGDIALNRETEWSKARNLKPDKSFETKLRYVFTILGYKVTELGQGKGREPDGVAISANGSSGYYSLIYDAKARENEYSMGTEDRKIIEYINKKKAELEKQRVDKVSFLIVSSEFLNNTSLENSIKNIYRATRVPVVLIRAKDLLYVVERKLSNSDIDHSQMEDLFLENGVLTREKIIDILG
jgi:hypothetical protein